MMTQNQRISPPSQGADVMTPPSQGADAMVDGAAPLSGEFEPVTEGAVSMADGRASREVAGTAWACVRAAVRESARELAATRAAPY